MGNTIKLLLKFLLNFILILLFTTLLYSQEIYKSSYRPRSGIAHGGIGAGSIELRKDGQFYNWSIFNNYPRGTGPIFKLATLPRSNDESSLLFFIVRYHVEGEDAKIKLLQLNNEYNEAALIGIAYYYPWMTAIEQIEYKAKYPYTKMKFTDSEMPFDIEMTVHNPFIPHDIKNSTLPGVYFDFTMTNHSEKMVYVFLIGTLRNLVGYDNKEKYFTSNLVEGKGYKYFDLSAEGMDKKHSTFGQMGMASLSDESTYYLGWEHKHPYYELLVVNNSFPNIDDTEGRNKIDKETGKKRGMYQYESFDQRHFSSIGVTKDLQTGESFRHQFLMSWYFPNAYGSYNAPNEKQRAAWNSEKEYWINQKITKKIGNYYNNFFSSSADVAEYMIDHKSELIGKTKRFFDDYYSSDLEPFLLEQISSHLNTFRTSATFNEAGQFGMREGMSADKSWGPNITSDVTYYGSSSIISLFPELQLSSMRAHKGIQQANGDIAHGLAYDLDYTQNATWGVTHRVDLAGNYIQVVIRDFMWTGDREFINEMWPSLKKAFGFAIKRWDSNGDGMPDMNGIMSSYDNFPMYGLASYIHSQWLNTAKGMYEVAKILNDKEMEQKAETIYKKATVLMEQHLWNGEYYVLANDVAGDRGIDDGCLTDQIIGQWMAHQSGFGHLLNSDHVKSALKKVLEMSYKPNFGLRNCTWPKYPDLFPIHESELWVDQANTCWTGVELALASFLMYEDMYDQAVQVAKTVDDRYRKNGLYFDHQEFGGHYLRPMAAWGILNGALGFAIRDNNYIFSPCIPKDNYKILFAFNKGTAFFRKNTYSIEIEVRSGEMDLNSVALPGHFVNKKSAVFIDGEKIQFSLTREGSNIVLQFSALLKLKSGIRLIIK
jgi:non-lysosomal glucosylceramidase